MEKESAFDGRGARYRLAPYTQVRAEDFGLLFYTMAGPRLYFLSSSDLLACSFFEGKTSLEKMLKSKIHSEIVRDACIESVKGCLNRLAEKGVIVECEGD